MIIILKELKRAKLYMNKIKESNLKKLKEYCHNSHTLKNIKKNCQ